MNIVEARAAIETLRRAASQMRERAESATQGPWSGEAIGSEGHHVFAPEGSRAPMKGRARVAACTWRAWNETDVDAEHIASWHPDVALAVADLLDNEASLIIAVDAIPEFFGATNSARVDLLLALARTYLGEEVDA